MINDFKYYVAITGGPCSGKTTTLKALREKINPIQRHIIYEYATDYLLKKGAIKTNDEQFTVTMNQLGLEQDERVKSHPFITECPAYVGMVYHQHYFGNDGDRVYKPLLNGLKYDAIFHLDCMPFFENNGIRYQNDIKEAIVIGDKIKEEGKRHTDYFVELPVMDLDARVDLIERNI